MPTITQITRFLNKELDIKKIKDYNWNKVYKKNFCVRLYNSRKFEERELASYIWRRLKKPKVNLTNPCTKIEIYYIKNKFYCCLLLSEIEKSFLKRKSQRID